MDRRQLLRAGAALAAGGPAALAACSDDTGPGAVASAPSSTTATSTTTTTVTTTSAPPEALYDPDMPYWLQGGFAPVFDEVTSTELEVEGALPPALHGLYARNGSNPATGTSPHWFFGDGMVHGVRFEHGKATWYGNRWVATPYVERRAGFGELDGPPGRDATQSNVSVFHHHGRLLSLGEVGWPFELDPADLSTLGPLEITGPAGAVGPNVTAHPKRDPATGLLHFFGYGFTPPFLTYYVASADGRELLVREEVAVEQPTMIHDFAITETDVVFWELPVLFDLAAAAAGSKSPFAWTPEYGSRLGVMPLGGPAADMVWVEIDNGYVFHGTNAYRDGDRIVLDVSRMDRMFAQEDSGPSLLTRWEVDLSGPAPSWTETPLSEIALELPEVDERVVGRPHAMAWLLETHGTLDGNLELNGLARFDVATGGLDRWSPGPAVQPGEAQFVPDSPDAAEGEGWLLSFVWDRATDSSSLAVLDATDVSSGPVASIHLPQRVPFGFHGTWIPGTT